MVESNREVKMSQVEDMQNYLYKNPKEPIEARIKDLLSRMTLKEKIGQMTQIERRVANPSHIRDFSIGTLYSCIFHPSKFKIYAFIWTFLFSFLFFFPPCFWTPIDRYGEMKQPNWKFRS